MPNLGASAHFLHALSESASADWRVAATRTTTAVKLTGVAERRTGRKAEADGKAGDFDDFDNWPMVD